MAERQGDSPSTGLIRGEVTVVFNVTAGGENKNELRVDLSAPVGTAPVTIGAGGTSGSTATASRGNQITVRFVNVMYAPDGSLITAKTPADFEHLMSIFQTRKIKTSDGKEVPFPFLGPLAR